MRGGRSPVTRRRCSKTSTRARLWTTTGPGGKEARGERVWAGVDEWDVAKTAVRDATASQRSGKLTRAEKVEALREKGTTRILTSARISSGAAAMKRVTAALQLWGAASREREGGREVGREKERAQCGEEVLWWWWGGVFIARVANR